MSPSMPSEDASWLMIRTLESPALPQKAWAKSLVIPGSMLPMEQSYPRQWERTPQLLYRRWQSAWQRGLLGSHLMIICDVKQDV